MAKNQNLIYNVINYIKSAMRKRKSPLRELLFSGMLHLKQQLKRDVCCVR